MSRYSEIEYVNPITCANFNTLLNDLSYSTDDNTRTMGLFLHKLVNEFGVSLEPDEIRIINSNIKVNNGNYIYRNSRMNNIKAHSTSCLLVDLFNDSKLNTLGNSVLRKTLNGTLGEDEEFYAYISALSLRVDDEDQEKLKDVIDVYTKYYNLGGDKDTILDNIRKMLILVDLNGLKFKKTVLESCYSPKEICIYLNNNVNDSFTVFHEFGHAMDDFFNRRSHDGQDYESLYRKARSKARSNPKFKSILNKLIATMDMVYDDAKDRFDYRMLRAHGSKEAIRQSYRNVITNYIIVYTNSYTTI